jgi:hypothetical protein
VDGLGMEAVVEVRWDRLFHALGVADDAPMIRLHDTTQAAAYE